MPRARSRRNAGFLLHAPSIARTVPLLCPWRCSGIPQQRRTAGRKTLQWSARHGSVQRGGDTRRHGGAITRGDLRAPDVHDDARGRRSTLGRGRTCSGSPVLAVLVLGERPEPPLDLSDPALELFDLTTRRPELLHDGLGQALELPLERRHQAHPPSVQLLHRALRLLLDIRAQVPDVDQRENLLNHRLAAAFDQLARVVPQLADQPLPPPPQPFDRSTNIVQREQPCLFLFHEALLSAADGAVFSGSAQLRVTKRQTKSADSSTEERARRLARPSG